MQDEQPERSRDGVPIHNPMLQRVIDAGREIRLLNRCNPVTMVCYNYPSGQTSTVTYKLPDDKGGVHFRIGGREVIPTLEVRVWPTTLFQEKVLPGELLFSGLRHETGFLDPPRDIIRFQDMVLATHMGMEKVSTVHFSLTGDDNIYAGVRLILNKIAFAD